MSQPDDVETTRNRAIIFDLDGTLIDPFVGISSAYRAMVRDLELADIPDDTIRRLIGPPIQEAVRSLMLPETKIDDAVRSFRHHYGLTGVHHFSPIPGIEAVLRGLLDAGHPLCIATSKPREYAIVILEEAGWSSLFSIVSGPGLDGSGRQKREVIQDVLEKLDTDVGAFAMVGDRSEDVTASVELGIPAIGVTWGFGSVDELVAAGAYCIVEAPENLPAAIAEID